MTEKKNKRETYIPWNNLSRQKLLGREIEVLRVADEAAGARRVNIKRKPQGNLNAYLKLAAPRVPCTKE